MTPNNSDRGFTLLELMVALSIVATALVTLLGTHLLSLNLAQRQKEQTMAVLLARQKMEETMTMEFDSIASESGDFGDIQPGYYWETEIEEADIENLKSVEILIKYPDGEFRLKSFVARDIIE